MIGDKRLEEPKTESETMDILEHFQILHDPKDYTFNALQLVELNNEVYEKMLQDAMKKQKPIRMIHVDDTEFICSTCGKTTEDYDITALKVCPECGQKLLWG